MRSFLPFAMAVVLLAGLSSCAPKSEHSASATVARGTPNVLEEIARQPGSPWKAYELRTFQTNHIWAGAGYKPGGDNYRAKITLWDNDANLKDAAVAELFFRDPAQLDAKRYQNPDPNSVDDGKPLARPYRLNFPTAALESVLSTLRSANEPVYLYYYDNQWAVGVVLAEPVGAD